MKSGILVGHNLLILIVIRAYRRNIVVSGYIRDYICSFTNMSTFMNRMHMLSFHMTAHMFGFSYDRFNNWFHHEKHVSFGFGSVLWLDYQIF